MDNETILDTIAMKPPKLSSKDIAQVREMVKDYNKTAIVDDAKLVLGLSLGLIKDLLTDPTADIRLRTEAALKMAGHSMPSEAAVMSNGEETGQKIIIQMNRPQE